MTYAELFPAPRSLLAAASPHTEHSSLSPRCRDAEGRSTESNPEHCSVKCYQADLLRGKKFKEKLNSLLKSDK